MACWRIQVEGVVQGVGFRPFVWQLAKELGIVGRVWNDGQGVVIEACASQKTLDALINRIQTEAPPLAQVERVRRSPIEARSFSGFEIVESDHTAMMTQVPADAATCPDCLAEVFDPANRRHGYAFTNCTHCGPRYSIITAMPYDRPNTTMAAFPMCPDCQAEYENPADRRFHAQPNACPRCGPHLEYWHWRDGQWVNEIFTDMFPLIELMAQSLKHGGIWAVKGLGGFHLVCSAHDENAVARLRVMKRRPHKPFALMATLDELKRHVEVPEMGIRWLKSPAAPIVLVQKKKGGLKKSETTLAETIAPGQSQLGFMLPHTPLHHALLQAFEGVLVMTSCNISGQPQLYEDAAVLETFAGVLDGAVGHNRPIVRRLEDSVVRICPLTGERAQVVRLARGLAPFHQPVVDKQETTPISATGADLKAAIALKRGCDIVLSQYLGDLSNAENHAAYEQAWQDLHALYQHRPEAVVADNHPAYFSHAFAQKQNLEVKTVQHHCAHLAAVLAEKKADPHQAYLGVILDGLGYGDDGGFWGGELLRWQNGSCKRLSYAEPFRLLGGEKAQKTPWRILLSLLWQYKGRSWGQARRFQGQLASLPLDLLYQAWEKGINAPYTTSVARWFDALAALTGLWWDEMSYEGQAAQLTEAAFDPACGEAAPFGLTPAGQLSVAPFLDWWLEEPDRPTQVVVTAFYRGLAEVLISWVDRHWTGEENGVVFSGGVAQNLTLVALIKARWPTHLPPLLVAKNTPANDQGIAIGQSYFLR